MKRVITVADDFGLSLAVNEAVETAARDGILTSASLMVAAPCAADAVRRARGLIGRLHVGLHLVVIEGPAMLPPSAIPALVDAAGQFPSEQLRLGLRYAFAPAIRRQLKAEIRAQFAAFAATGLTLDHANAHKHMHLHPVVGAMMIRIGREFGLRAIRVPAEPPHPALPRSMADKALFAWAAVLRRQAHREGLLTNDAILGLSATGHMTPALTQSLLNTLPEGLTELYFHPASARDATLARLMPAYEHTLELQALVSARPPQDVVLTSYSQQS